MNLPIADCGLRIVYSATVHGPHAWRKAMTAPHEPPDCGLRIADCGLRHGSWPVSRSERNKELSMNRLVTGNLSLVTGDLEKLIPSVTLFSISSYQLPVTSDQSKRFMVPKRGPYTVEALHEPCSIRREPDHFSPAPAIAQRDQSRLTSAATRFKVPMRGQRTVETLHEPPDCGLRIADCGLRHGSWPVSRSERNRELSMNRLVTGNLSLLTGDLEKLIPSVTLFSISSYQLPVTSDQSKRFMVPKRGPYTVEALHEPCSIRREPDHFSPARAIAQRDQSRLTSAATRFKVPMRGQRTVETSLFSWSLPDGDTLRPGTGRVPVHAGQARLIPAGWAGDGQWSRPNPHTLRRRGRRIGRPDAHAERSEPSGATVRSPCRGSRGLQECLSHDRRRGILPRPPSHPVGGRCADRARHRSAVRTVRPWSGDLISGMRRVA